MKDLDVSTDENSRLFERVRPVIALTMGDANGIGPEVIFKCVSDSRLSRIARLVVFGSRSVLTKHASQLGFEGLSFVPFEHADVEVDPGTIELVDVATDFDVDVEFGSISARAGKLAMLAVEAAARQCSAGVMDGMVTAPISKKAISSGGYDVPGHTEFIAALCGSPPFTMMMVADRLRVGLVTGHISIWDVPKKITRHAILRRLSVIMASLQTDFGISRPRIAVLALNPHAGEGGMMGKEELETIAPAVEQAHAEGQQVYGPFPADGFFGTSAYLKYDAVLAMYHDQGLVPFKALAFDSGVNFTAGLPIVRTSPDHGTAFDIAGQGKAAPDSMRSAIYLAVDVARRRLAVQL